MAQQGEISQNQNVQGLFTEGSPLNYPPGATVRDENFILRVDGSRARRLGLGQEDTGFISESLLSGPMYVFDWDAVGNDGSLNFGVIVTNGSINIVDKSFEPLHTGLLYSETAYFTIGGDYCSGTVINGNFVLLGTTGGEVKVYSYSDGVITLNTYKIRVRDIWGVDDPLDTDQRPSSLTSNHAYNIANQGWRFTQAYNVRTVGVETQQVTDPDTGEEQTVVTSQGIGWPSNADLVTYGISEADEDDRFKEKLFRLVPFGTTPAPKGSCIVNLTNMGQDRLDFANSKGYSAYTDLADYSDSLSTGPKTCASYAGRVFYAGFLDAGSRVNDTYPNFTSTIAFSRAVSNEKDINKCYQQEDPTTLDSEILASDGGTVQVAGSGFIYKLVATGRSLLIFASEGVWELYSTDQIFSADNYQLRKLTDIGCSSPRSVVLVDSIPIYWTDYGIYALQPDQVSDSFVAQNITQNTIQSFYDNISGDSVRNCFGFYDKFDKKVRWLYSDDTNPLSYNRELIFDSRLQSWYTNVYPDASAAILGGMMSLNIFSEVEVTEDVVVGSDNVLVGTDQVIVNERLPEKGKRSYKYVVKDTSLPGIQFYEFNQLDFKDFGTTDAEAIMITGPYTGGDSVRRKSSTYLTVQLRKTELGFEDNGNGLEPINPGSCIVETRWDWTDLAVAGKFNNPIEMYRHRRHYLPTGIGDNYDDGNTVISTKSRLRGSGRSLALKITSSPEKDLDILGYNVQINQNEKV